MSISSTLLLIAVAISHVIARAPDAAQATSKPDNNFFPIMAWDGVPNDPRVLDEDARMRSDGCRLCATVRGLDACHAAGLKAIVSDRTRWRLRLAASRSETSAETS